MGDSAAQNTTSTLHTPPPDTTILSKGEWCNFPKKVLLERIAKADLAECPICLDRERDTAFIPCGHRACAACAGQVSLSRCPVCREPFSGTLRVY